MSFEIPMFPLGSVLFPNAVLPLHVFEPRYLALVDACLADDGRFGVVLIERGSEVGGGDTRFGIGTVAQIAGMADLEEGRRLIVAVGTERFEITDWLPDDPYPRALVETLTEPDLSGSMPEIDEVERKLRKTLALMSEAGYDVGDTGFELSETFEVAVHQLCALAPLSPLDAQRLLAAESPPARLAHLRALLDEEIAVLQQQLQGG